MSKRKVIGSVLMLPDSQVDSLMSMESGQFVYIYKGTGRRLLRTGKNGILPGKYYLVWCGRKGKL